MGTGTAKFDVTMGIKEREGRIEGEIEYNREVMEEESVERMVGHYKRLLEAIVADPQQQLSRLPLLTRGERQQLLVEWNQTRAEYKKRSCVHELFEEQVRQTPAAVALEYEQEQLSYRELNERANQVAQYLRRLGVGPQRLVGVCMERSIEMLVGLLGILKAGGGYVPLDPAYPRERLSFMMEDARLFALLTQAQFIERLPAHERVVCLDINWSAIAKESRENPSKEITADNSAYVIYTSGSTGKPKGVQIPHRAVVNFLSSMREQLGVTEREIFLALTTLSFDIAALEIFLPISVGARVVLIAREIATDADRLAEAINNSRITTMQATPATWRMLVQAGWQGSAELKILCGGEALPRDLADQLLERGACLWNLYGPTETTIWSAASKVESKGQTVSIGRPLWNTEIYVLDARQQPVPIGVRGELYIGGDGLADGYLNRAELTADKFIPHPFGTQPGARLYRTGDVARYLPRGNIEFLGRLDHQVKVRGFRIELSEIEAVLNQHSSVRGAVVVAREDRRDDKRLVAYVVTDEEELLTAGELRSYLGQYLPVYMLPSAFVRLDALPLTPNGKVDRRALPAPEQTGLVASDLYIAPRNTAEEKLAGIFAHLLNAKRVGAEDSFFELGGHSLLAVQLVSHVRDAFNVELPLRRIFETPRVSALACVIAEGLSRLQPAGIAPPLPQIVAAPDERHQPFPLTDLQQAYWIGHSGAFELGNVSAHGYMEIESADLDLARLNRAWQQLIERHEMLRAIVLPDGQQQILNEVPPYEIEVVDLRDKEPSTDLEAVRQRMSQHGPSINRWPLFEVRAHLLDKDRVRLHISMSLLICDAWSFQLLTGELARLYQDSAATLAPLDLSFRDYVLALESLRDSEIYLRSQKYWWERLAALPPAPELPLARNPASLVQPVFVRRTAHLSADRWLQLKTRAKSAGLTPTVVLCAAYAEVLATWSKTQRFTINALFFNRHPLHPQVNEVVGNFSSTNLLEIDTSNHESFRKRARRLHARLWEDLEHSYVNGVRVIREMNRMQGGTARATMPVVFASTLNMNPAQMRDTPSGLDGEIVYSALQTPQVWLDHQVFEEDGALVFNWDALDELFPEGLVAEMFSAYCRLLHRLADQAESWQEVAVQLTPPEQIAERVTVNATESPVKERLLHDLFAEQKAARPLQKAVIAPTKTLTYEELSRYANLLAHQLRRLGARPNTLVAVVMEKGWEQVAAVLGILQSGAAYLPIDAGLPTERRAHLLQHGEVKVVLTQSWLNESLHWPTGIERLCVDTLDLSDAPLETLSPLQRPEDLAYVIYTSGSTGLPKGVMVDHRGAVNTICDINERFGVEASDRVLALSSLSFDLSVYDIFGLLAAGGTIIFPEASASASPARWAELIVQEKVTIWNSVPALMEMLVEYAQHRPALVQDSLRLVLLSGDWIAVSLPERIKNLFKNSQVISLGGATEASIWSILYTLETIDPEWKSIPYGKPMLNQRFHVLNERLEPCPIWVVGQLYIGGVGLAKGYWRDEEKTRASFISDPRTGERLYRTGDLGRYLPDGNIEFLGREDFQVKVQGYRIELGEIEAALSEHEMVRACVVVAVGERHKDKRLVAYVVTEDGHAINTDELRGFLGDKLPGYMIPSGFVTLEALPLTPNGKVDRQRLPAPDLRRNSQPRAYEPPRDALEQELSALWAEILEQPQIGIHDNFFDLGGHSLAAVRLISRIHQRFHVDLQLSALLQHASIEELASLLRLQQRTLQQREEQLTVKPTHQGGAEIAMTVERGCSPLVALRSSGHHPPLFCVHPVGGTVLCYSALSRHLGTEQPFYGLQSCGLDGRVEPLETIEQMAATYLSAIREVQASGPYTLAGWSLGGVVAFEMNRQLKSLGEQVRVLLMIDSWSPVAGMAVGDAELLRWFLKDLGVRPQVLPEAGLTDKGDAEEHLGAALEVAHEAGLLPADMGLPQLSRLFGIFKTNMRAMWKYVPRGSVERITLLRAGSPSPEEFRRHPAFAAADTALGWGALSDAGVDVHTVPGDHYSILAEPNVQVLAERLKASLFQSSGVTQE
ncbi:MAG TPA: amino acid adenylation domain-containing protein [Pyrinomonadaceae bacterium]